MKFACAPETRPLSGYTIKRAIDRGAFGEVYYAVSDAGKEVALKLLHTNQAAELRGVSQCLNLKHPNLVAIYDIRTDDEGDAWVVMEYIAGESLEQRLSRSSGGMPVDEVLKWVEGFAAGVDYLHARGIVHRDLKPANVFLDGGLVKIADVGLSKFMTPSRRSAQTESVGTVYYMAPEVAHGKYGRELDVYSLGIMAYEMLTGRVPFDGESTGEILMKHLAQGPDLEPIPERLRPVIGAALEKDPQKRTPTAGQLAAAFRRAVTGRNAEPSPPVIDALGSAAAVMAVPPSLPVNTALEGIPVVEHLAKSAHLSEAVPGSAAAPVVGDMQRREPVESGSPVPRWLFPTVFGSCLVLIIVQRTSARVKWEELAFLMVAAAIWQSLDWWQSSGGPSRRGAGRWFSGWLARRGYELRPDWRGRLGAVFITGGLVTAAFVGFVSLGLGLLAVMLVPGMVAVLQVVAVQTILQPLKTATSAVERTAPAAGPFISWPLKAKWPVAVSEPVAKVVATTPPPLPEKRTSVPRAPVVSVGDLFTSLAMASGWAVVVTALLVGLMPEWDAEWQPLRDPLTAVYLGLTTTVSAWLMLAGVWVLQRHTGRVKRLRVVLMLAGIAAGAAVYGVGEFLEVSRPFHWRPGHTEAIVSQLGRHSLLEAGQPTFVGLTCYFALLFGMRSWWKVLSPDRKERLDLWDAAATVAVALLLTVVVRFSFGWALLWGLSLALVLPLAATRFSGSRPRGK